jgi:hypothetical protein
VLLTRIKKVSILSSGRPDKIGKINKGTKSGTKIVRKISHILGTVPENLG